MPDTNNNTRVSLRELLESRFDALDDKLDERWRVLDLTVVDHEDRIRALEKQTMPRTIAELGAMIVAVWGLVLAYLRGNA
jgi:hypothetical protein